MWRSLASNAMTFLVVVVFVLAGVLLWGQNQYSAQGPLAQAICVEVPRGTSMRKLSQTLEERGAISNGSIFRLGADYTKKTQALKAGSYLVKPNASMAEITDVVTRGGASTCGTEVVYRIGVTRASVQVREINPATGRYEEMAAFNPAEDDDPAAYTAVLEKADTRYRIALAEGVTSWQIVNALNGIDLLEGSVEQPAEGALAPDSYEFSPGDSRDSVISRMVDAQKLILAQAWEGRASGLPYETPEEALVMASIVEKETGGDGERGLVASVFVNRLEKGMRLQTDPTVIYGITKGEGTLGRGLRQSELRKATAYNTYVIPALPPTPIANPGRASIEAALNPEQSDFIFFVAKSLDPRDGHNFAVTLDEHNRNVAAYRALERAN
ncbi:endolytic transglycosylase MltG [uncultured Pelagimonas sp.]|uniref:endolytic transglycosylase MltG n=1 Tax=uncultured Pelagimonas sp. TaxID=1618102 RepID=UPI00260BA86A|nr:endolytic transglycosylase MltG [uncultured Pelagimonas sp.]